MGLGKWLEANNLRDPVTDDSEWGPLPAIVGLVLLYAVIVGLIIWLFG